MDIGRGTNTMKQPQRSLVEMHDFLQQPLYKLIAKAKSFPPPIFLSLCCDTQGSNVSLQKSS